MNTNNNTTTILSFLLGVAIVGSVLSVDNNAFASHVTGADFTVDDANADDECNDGDGAVIQKCHDAAAAGDIIEVEPGTYSEEVTISKDNLEFKGAEAGNDARSGRPTSSESIVGTAAGAFVVNANGVTIDGFKITGASDVTGGDAEAGIETSDANSGYTIKNNLITKNELGVRLLSDGTDPTTFEKNLVKDNDLGGLDGNARGLTAGQISGTLVNAVIQNNDFKGNTEGSNSADINLSNSNNAKHDDITISNNLFETSVVFTKISSTNGLTLSDNTIVHNDGTPSSTAVFIGGDVKSMSITGNTITGNDRGINIDDLFEDVVNEGITASNNRLEDSGIGLRIANTNGDGFTGTLDATDNWWGHSSGPGGDGPGTGDDLVDPDSEVVFNPWCQNPTCSPSSAPEATASPQPTAMPQATAKPN